MKATKRLLDSVWTVEYTHASPNDIVISKIGGNDQEGYDKESILPQCEIIETPDRTVVGLLFRKEYKPFEWVNFENCDKLYTVVNPKHIFAYE